MFIKLQPEHKVFVSVIANFVFPAAEEITQPLDHVKLRLTLQLINGISSVLQKLFQYFNGTMISTSFALPSSGFFLLFLP